MFVEEELVPISALQHFLFCDRQAGLIHIDGAWADNELTTEGHILHRTVDAMRPELRGGVMLRRGVPIVSWRLGLTGKADVVELRPTSSPNACSLEHRQGRWEVVPIEYKRGRPKAHRADEVQLCAQGLCFEEMLGAVVARGELFYGRTRRRLTVTFDAELRRVTEEATRSLHEMFRSRRVPIRSYAPKCRRCSLRPICLPVRRSGTRSATEYLRIGLDTNLGADAP